MKTTLALAALAAIIVTPALAGEGTMKMGVATSVQSSFCLKLDDLREIKDYALAHNSDGYTAWKQKVAEGKCADTTFMQAVPIQTIPDIAWKDSTVGDIMAVQFRVTKKDGTKMDIYGLFGPEQIDNGRAT